MTGPALHRAGVSDPPVTLYRDGPVRSLLRSRLHDAPFLEDSDEVPRGA